MIYFFFGSCIFSTTIKSSIGNKYLAYKLYLINLTEKEVELTIEEFRQYVEDKWQWKHQFFASTSMYNNKA